MQIPLRIRSVLGADTSTIDKAVIGRLLGWQEDTDLDFKQSLDRTPKGRARLVSDVAAMANANGGVIVVGIREEDTLAVELTPVRRDRQREDRTEIFQSIAEFVRPHLSIDIRQVEAEAEDHFFLVLTIPRSGLAPHAVRHSRVDLRYPMRDGTRTRHMAEPELAARYRDRFRQAGALIDRLEQVRSEGEEVVRRSKDRQGWLCLALVPEASGRFSIDVRTPGRFLDWLTALMGDVSPMSIDPDAEVQGSVGFRRLIVGDWRDRRLGGEPLLLHCQFHADGSGFYAQWCSFPREAREIRDYKSPRRSPIAENEARYVLVTTAENLFDRVVVGLSALARHAIDHCGANGEAVISASLVPLGAVESTVTARVQAVRGLIVGLGQTPGTHELQRASSSQYTVPLRSLYSPSVEMMITVRMVMTDLLSLFGQAGVEQISDDGSLVPRGFQSDLSPERTSSWARRLGIPIVKSGHSE